MIRLIVSHVKIALLAASLATLLPLACANATGTQESLTPSLLSPAVQEDSSVLNRRLSTAKKDLEQFLVFAEYFGGNGDAKSVEQLQSPVDDFLKRHVDPLVLQGTEQVNLETTRLSAEILFTKTRLFIHLNQTEAAMTTIAEMKKRFGPSQKSAVLVSGRSTTLGEATRQLDEELARTARTKKK